MIKNSLLKKFVFNIFLTSAILIFSCTPVLAHGGEDDGHGGAGGHSAMNHATAPIHNESNSYQYALYIFAALLLLVIILSVVRKDYRKIPPSYLLLFFILISLIGWGIFIQGPKAVMQNHMMTKTYGPGNNADGPLHMIGFSKGLKQEDLQKTDDISKDPTDLPGPITRNTEAVVPVTLVTKEVVAKVNDDATYYYWTFNGTVPGPFIRVREGDTIELTISNDVKSIHTHSVDFHAVTGPGGGAAITQIEPGKTKKVRFKALNPGLFTYHCATPDVPSHMANGMYGQILVEPKEGLPKVNREFYVMQGELFTTQEMGAKGFLEYDSQKLLDEKPTFFLFNGKPGGPTKKMTANVGEKVRIFFGNGSVAVPSAFHVIGEIFDHAWPEGGWSNTPVTNSQSILVGAGSSAIVDFKIEVPGTYVLVDHALARLYKGAYTTIKATGVDTQHIYNDSSAK